ncbi:hypothetical protein EVAR_74708_1 [Eumeta japonica]|uniref:Uncharacterized protein n=1 Tax=Eumeta variegata TaxID=151549 RepID=A0A4C1SPH9_EUMVA|nr:hypothetical protein EVAR_74708_1 [Eumeta japonica]
MKDPRSQSRGAASGERGGLPRWFRYGPQGLVPPLRVGGGCRGGAEVDNRSCLFSWSREGREVLQVPGSGKLKISQYFIYAFSIFKFAACVMLLWENSVAAPAVAEV